MKILIADDQEDIRTMVKLIFTKQGHEVITDSTGSFAEQLYRDLPDLIIMDINLDVRDGGDICTKLKKQPETRDIPIILISSIMDLPKICQFCGAQDYLVKPFHADELVKKVQQLTGSAA